MRKFGGFTESQMTAIASSMGYDGPLSGFNDFIKNDPHKAARLSRMTAKARDHVENPKQNFASGGVVDPITGKTVEAATTVKKDETKTTEPAISTTDVTKKVFDNPSSVITPAKVENIDANKNQLIDQNSGQVSNKDPQADLTKATASTATVANQPKTATVNTATTAAGVNKATQALNHGVHGTVSDNAQVTAAEAMPSANATVQGQLSQLMTQFQGGQTPAWAAGALRQADAIMAARGMGGSSMAASASTQAVMESALDIAVKDATTYSAFEMKNLDNRQQAALQNAQSYLQMDLTNVNNDQQALLAKTQLRTQALFTDAAAENATKQFNATSTNQSNQFFAQLRTQVSQFNAAQRTATSQFNAGQANQVEEFNKTIQDQRDQFNAQNRLIIDQANAKWRQTIATTDNANVNEANRQDAQLASGLTTAAYNNLWQTQRDLISFAFTASENDKQRASELTLAKRQANDQKQSALWEAAGSVVGQLIKGF